MSDAVQQFLSTSISIAAQTSTTQPVCMTLSPK